MKTTKACAIVSILTIIGLAVSVIGVIGGTIIFCNNWESHEEIPVEFKKNETSKTTGYYDCNCDNLSVYQDDGNRQCKYSISYKSRNQRNYEDIATNINFTENDSATSPYSLQSHWWNDVCFKVKKTAGTSTYSKLVLSLGQTND